MIAAQEEAQGRSDFAASQRAAYEKRLEGKILQSKAIAAAAASGGGAGEDAPTIVKLLTETGKRAEYAAETVIYQGEDSKAKYFAGAKARRETGNNSLLGGYIGAFGDILSGVGRFAASPVGV